MATFKIELRDKAAFLNRLEKQGNPISSDQIKDNKLEGYFEVTILNPEQLEAVKAILKQSPKINTIKEMKQTLTRESLKEMVRQELRSVLAEKKEMELKKKKKEKLDENEDYLDENVDPNTLLNIFAGIVAVAGPAAGLYIRKKAKDIARETGVSEEEVLQKISNAGKKKG